MPLLFGGYYPLLHVFFEIMERTSPIHSRAGSHIFLLSLFLCRFDEPFNLLSEQVAELDFCLFSDLVRDLKDKTSKTLGLSSRC